MNGERQRGACAAGDEPAAAQAQVVGNSLVEILDALLHGRCLRVAVPIALARVERSPLARAVHFDGDLLRGLMEVPAEFWGRHPPLYDRYREALRRGASLRRRLPVDERMRFWSPLPTSCAEDEAGDQ